MKMAIAVLALILSSAVPAVAQTGTIQHITLSGSATGFMGGGGTQPASIAGATFSLTQRISLGYEQITIPSVASFDMGIGQYTLPFSSLMGKKISSHFVFDASKVNVTFMAGAGKLLQSAQNVSRIAETAGVYVSYPISGNLSVRIVGAQYIHGGVQNGLLTTPSTAAISTGLSLSF